MIGPAFGKEARVVVVQARQAAMRVGSAEVASDHLLLALAESATTAGRFLREHGVMPEILERLTEAAAGDADLLASLGIDVEEVRTSIERRYGDGTWRRAMGRKVPGFSTDAKRTLVQTAVAAKSMGTKRISADTMLLAVLQAGRQAGAVLKRLDINPSLLERQLLAAQRAA